MDRILLLSKIIDEIGAIKGEKSLQKLIYLIQSYSETIGYNFSWDRYGPIAFELHNDVKEAEALGLAKITWENEIPIYQVNFTKDTPSQYWKNKYNQLCLSPQMKNIISKIKTKSEELLTDPNRLEIMASIDYLSKTNEDDPLDDLIRQTEGRINRNEIIETVKSMNKILY